MKSYGRRTRTVTTFAISNNEPKDISFSQSESEESESISSDSYSLLTDSQSQTNKRNAINRIITSETNGTNTSSSDQIVDSAAIGSSFEVMGTEASSDIDATSPPNQQMSPRKTKLKAGHMSELQAFDFLDNSKRIKKRRRTNYYKHVESDFPDPSAGTIQERNESSQNDDDSDDDVVYGSGNMSSSMGKVLENVGNFLRTLAPENEHSLEDLFNEERNPLKQIETHSESTNGAQRVYNSRRTFLMRNSTAEEEEQNMVDEYLEEIEIENSSNNSKEDLSFHINTPFISKKNDKTRTVNELKNIGDTLKYQEDYDYLTSNLKYDTPINDAISILAEFIIALKNDNNILKYILKHHCLDIVWWCLQIETNNDQLLIMQGYILNTFYKQATNTNIPKNLPSSLIHIAHCIKIPAKLRNGSKMQSLTYSDFLKINDGKSGFHYALNIWHSCMSTFSIIQIGQIFDLLIKLAHKPENRSVLDESKFFQVLQNILLIYNDGNKANSKNEVEKICGLHALRNDLIDNENYIKCAILETNDLVTNMDCKEEILVSLFEEAIIHTLHNLDKINKVSDNVIMLQLALCLNLIDYYKPVTNQLSPIMSQLKNIIFRKDYKQYSSITDSLLHLIFAYLIIINRGLLNNINPINETQRETILESLRQFSKMGDDINNYVKGKIDKAILEIELYKM